MSFDPNAAAQPDSGVFGLPHSAEEARVVLIPVPFEATTSYGGGTVDGPKAILEASKQVDLFDIETGTPYQAGIHMLEEPTSVRAWNDEARKLAQVVIEEGGANGDPMLEANLEQVNALSERMNAWVHAEAKKWISAGKLVGVVGGDHSTPFGNIQAHAEAHPGMGVLHLDAHADLRVAYEGFIWSHASIMHNVVERIPGVARLVQVGIRDFCEEEHQQIVGSKGRIVTHFDALLAAEKQKGVTWAQQLARIVEPLPKDVYLSFDIDGLDPVLCPHTGTPVPGGLSFHEATALVRAVCESGRRIVGFDLNEVAPGPDDEWDGNVGARLLYKMIGWALKSRG
ncbi:MAG: agmatinase family protein [Deltaproteobacteria bacterium]|nr:agmatinase family protein [Deltaproteobacteria bacterium]